MDKLDRIAVSAVFLLQMLLGFSFAVLHDNYQRLHKAVELLAPALVDLNQRCPK